MTTDFKRGQTFAYAGQVRNNGQTMDFTGWSISSQLRTAKSSYLVEDLSAAFVDAATGAVSLSATAAQTSLWPLQPLVLDIRLQDPAGQVVISETVTINVVERVTYA
ncbi:MULTISPECIES: hypothetical protein [unclassified Cupriavidus]|uniref:hypothetical protein n=1 Tax=unclassified Cupriavidus TaxID=2640874 RepID=UPI00313B3972